MTAGKRCIYLTEGECEEKLVNALKEQPSLVIPGKVKKFNVITQELKTSQLMTFAPGSMVVLIFDTDVEISGILKKNICLLEKTCRNVTVATITQVLNFEDEVVRATDISRAQDLTKSKSIAEFKTVVNRLKAMEFRHALQRHKFDIDQLWIKEPPDFFKFLSQDGNKIKIVKP